MQAVDAMHALTLYRAGRGLLDGAQIASHTDTVLDFLAEVYAHNPVETVAAGAQRHGEA